MLDVQAYLDRIAYRGALAPTLPTLRALHRAHMRAVPFENLDIHRGRPLSLDDVRLFHKVVEQRRGGFCYELNGLFARLLRALGFDVTLLGATVLLGGGEPRSDGGDTDHLLLAVQLGERWMADVGFGDSFLEPLRLDDPLEQRDAVGISRVEADGERRLLLRRAPDGGWQPQYGFMLRPRVFDEFRDPGLEKEQSPFWRDRSICSRATVDGRVTLSGRTLITTTAGGRSERMLTDDEYLSALREHFGVEL